MRDFLLHDLSLQGLKLRLLEWPGPEPTLLMLHGFLDTGLTFFELAEHLPCHLLAWDARGFGHSDWLTPPAYYHFYDYLYDLQSLLQELKLAPLYLLGHSMGGMIASLYAGVFPSQVQALINLEGWMMPDTAPETTPERLAQWLQQRTELSPFQTWPDAQAAAARMQRQDPALRPEQARYLADYALETLPTGQVRWRHDPLHRTRSPQPFRLDQALACWRRIQAPSLLVSGADSPIQHLPDLGLRLAAFADRQEVVLPAAGHNLHWHQPEALAQSIRDFLRQQEAGFFTL